MAAFPLWLAALRNVNPWTQNTYDELYAVFEVDFKHSRPILEGHEVWYFSDMEGHREKIFWHLTSREDAEAGGRLPDLRRCERLSWVRCLIEGCGNAEVLFWDYLEADKTVHSYIWIKDHDFVVIMKKYKNGARRLVTSYYVDKSGKKRTFESKFRNRIK